MRHPAREGAQGDRKDVCRARLQEGAQGARDAVTRGRAEKQATRGAGRKGGGGLVVATLCVEGEK